MSLAGLLAAVAEDPQFRTALDQPQTPDGGERDLIAPAALRPFLVAGLAAGVTDDHPQPGRFVLAVTATAREAEDLTAALRAFLPPYSVATFPELTEAPDYFLKEAVQDKQMNFLQLDAYIRNLQQSGFDTLKLQVQFYRKFSVPLFATIMAFIAVPFSFLVGRRGAMTGIGVSIAIALSYWGIRILFEKLGDVNLLPPSMAAWSPNALFSLTGLYLLTRMRS